MALSSATDIFSESEWSELVSDLCLSVRQAEVIQQLLFGHSDKQIALEIHVSVASVRKNLHRLFSKFNVQDRTELVLYVFHRFRDRSGPSWRSRPQ